MNKVDCTQNWMQQAAWVWVLSYRTYYYYKYYCNNNHHNYQIVVLVVRGISKNTTFM